VNNIEYLASPNHSSRNGAAISMIVLHATVGDYKSALAWLRNPQTKNPDDRVSTHYLIRKDGHVTQLVTDDRCAWHAGRASWLGHTDINERSLGIELENDNSGRDPYPAVQLDAARALCREKIARYYIMRGNIVRHLDVATPKGRKTDPAGFPFVAFVDSLYAAPMAPPDPHAALTHYRVLRAATGGATIRAAPRQNGTAMDALVAGADWYGEEIPGGMVTLKGFGSSSVWVRALNQSCVWRNLLEKVKES